MKLWLDAQLSPALATWMPESFEIEEAFSVQLDPVVKGATDVDIFHGARDAGAVVMTKDRDFADLVDRLGPPPQVFWITCGNTSNREMRRILTVALPEALALLLQGEPLVEISGLD